MRSRLEPKGAITATVHKLAPYVYAMLKHGQAYVSQGPEEYEAVMARSNGTGVAEESPRLGL